MLPPEDKEFLKSRLDELAERTTYALLETRFVISLFEKHSEILDPKRVHALVDSKIMSLSEEDRTELFG